MPNSTYITFDQEIAEINRIANDLRERISNAQMRLSDSVNARAKEVSAYRADAGNDASLRATYELVALAKSRGMLVSLESQAASITSTMHDLKQINFGDTVQ